MKSPNIAQIWDVHQGTKIFSCTSLTPPKASHEDCLISYPIYHNLSVYRLLFQFLKVLNPDYLVVSLFVAALCSSCQGPKRRLVHRPGPSSGPTGQLGAGLEEKQWCKFGRIPTYPHISQHIPTSPNISQGSILEVVEKMRLQCQSDEVFHGPV